MWICDQVLTEGHPLHWDLTFSSMIPTAASFPSTDLTTPFASFPAASSGPASVPTNVSVCLRGNCKWNLRLDQEGGSFISKCLPGHHISRSRSAGVDGYRVRFFSHGGANETVFECEHCNRAGLPAHTQHLELDRILVPERGCEETHVSVSWPGGRRTWLCMVNPVSAVLHVSRSLVLVTRCWSTLYATVHLPDTSFCSQALDLFTRSGKRAENITRQWF